MAYPRYSRGPVSAYTVNTGPPQAGPTAPQPYRPPTNQVIGGFGGQAAQFGQDSAVQRLAAHLASGTNPGSGLPGSIPDPVTSGPGPTDTTPPGITPPGVTPASDTGGTAPPSAAQQQADEAAGFAAFTQHATQQLPKNPAGLPDSTSVPYWVLNNPDGSPGNIDDVVGYTGPQIGTGLYTGAQGEPGTSTYMGIGYVPPEYQPGAIAAALRAITR